MSMWEGQGEQVDGRGLDSGERKERRKVSSAGADDEAVVAELLTMKATGTVKISCIKALSGETMTRLR